MICERDSTDKDRWSIPTLKNTSVHSGVFSFRAGTHRHRMDVGRREHRNFPPFKYNFSYNLFPFYPVFYIVYYILYFWIYGVNLSSSWKFFKEYICSFFLFFSFFSMQFRFLSLFYVYSNGKRHSEAWWQTLKGVEICSLNKELQRYSMAIKNTDECLFHCIFIGSSPEPSFLIISKLCGQILEIKNTT